MRNAPMIGGASAIFYRRDSSPKQISNYYENKTFLFMSCPAGSISVGVGPCSGLSL